MTLERRLKEEKTGPTFHQEVEVCQRVIVVGPNACERRPLTLHLSLPGAYAASKRLYCLLYGVLLWSSSEKNTFPLSLHRVAGQWKSMIGEAKSVFF
jgi:hypothetical protein